MNTNAQWRTLQDPAYTAQVIPQDQRAGYYVAPPNEHFDASNILGDGSSRTSMIPHGPGARRCGPELDDAPVEFARWRLTPRTIPMDEQKLERLAAIGQ